MATLALLAWRQGAVRSSETSSLYLCPIGGKQCTLDSAAILELSWKKPGRSSPRPTGHRLPPSPRLIHQLCRLMSCRIWASNLPQNAAHVTNLMNFIAGFVADHYVGFPCLRYECSCFCTEYVVGAPSSKIPNGLDASSVYRGVAASVREHLIDAFNRTQDYWRYCINKLRYRETRARSDIAGSLFLHWMTPALGL